MNIKFIEYDGISGYARVMYNDVKEADKYYTEVVYNGKDIKALLEYLFELENIRKEVREYIEPLVELDNDIMLKGRMLKPVLEILDKVGVDKE